MWIKISVFLCFLIVCRLTRVLVFVESVIVRKKRGGGYMWIDDGIHLEPFFSFWPVGRFWLVKTYQYGCHPSVLSHHALGTVECDESYCNERGTIFGRRGAGNSFTMSHSATRGSSWPYMDFKFFCDVSSGGWGYALICCGIWRGLPIYGNVTTPRVLGWLKCPLPNYYHLKVMPSMKLSVLLYQYQLDTCLAHHKPYS